ncbi:hypothetical protein BV25DRAFT_1916160 [Artomyces pyxidatus]|uniref:Uncharacterized protein n=1 Tax=Artomyces pyxidatus TaxID=48021 RepID=A0ACB8T0L4_9AGAM|nr:hypothetical protein BV25DRAFT_1916160 [Artomyces pyxidatus]
MNTDITTAEVRSPHTRLSPKPPKTTYARPVLGKLLKGVVLSLFCLAEFMDAFVALALFPAIPAIERSLDIKASEIVWIFSAYSATFPAFLLISGRVSDIYSSMVLHRRLSGCWLGFIASGLLWVRPEQGGMFVLRALTGIAAALTVPSALSGSPILKNKVKPLRSLVAPLRLAMLWGHHRWCLRSMGELAVDLLLHMHDRVSHRGHLSAVVLVPKSAPRLGSPSWRRLDLGGVALITTSIVLFVYAVTTGAATGWGEAKVIAPLIISVLLAAVFFILEARLDAHMASLAPQIWKYRNVPVLVALGLVPFFWWRSLFFQLMPLFQEKYKWSAILTSVHFLPAGIFGGLIAGPSGSFPKYINPKWTILCGLIADAIATILLPFGNTSQRYWSIIFPAFIIGTLGNMVVHTNSNIAIFKNTPPEIAGTVGAMFNAALQIGSRKADWVPWHR